MVITAAICVLLSLLSMAGYSGLLDARSGSGQPLAAAPTSSNRVTPDSTRDGSDGAAEASMYLFLHRTRHQALSALVTPGSGTCPERP